MSDSPHHAQDLDPMVLEECLEVDDLTLDPLDVVDDSPDASQEIQDGLAALRSDGEAVMQGLRVFCEHRDPRAAPLLLPLLDSPCPIRRMSAVYALGHNATDKALGTLLRLLRDDSNGYVRKAAAWSLASYAEPSVVEPLIEALTTDIAAVRLWAASSLLDVAFNRQPDALRACSVLMKALHIDCEPVVRSNCAWSLSKLHKAFADAEEDVGDMKEAIVQALLLAIQEDPDRGVADDALTALKQIEDPALVARLKTLESDGLLL